MKIPAWLRRLFWCIGLAFLADTAAAGPGDLDLTFNPSGTGSPPGTVVDQFPGLPSRLRKLALQPDGRIVGAGLAGEDLALVRWTPNGSLDPEFGNGGRVRVPLSGQPFLTEMTLQGDGKIVLCAIRNPFTVLRFLPNGSPDPAFGSGGTSTPPISGFIASLVPLSDGKLLAGGSILTDQFFPKLWRLLPDGSLDPSFGTAGGTVLPFMGGIKQVALLPKGKILTAGHDSSSPGAHVHLTRFDADGTVDTSFGGSSGTVFLEHSATLLDYIQFALADDDKILVNSIVQTSRNPDHYGLRVDRRLPDGTPDPSFGDGGHVQFDDYAQPAGIFVEPGGKVVLGAGVSLRRLLPDGRPDLHFGQDAGTVQFRFPDVSSGAFAMAPQPNRKILLGGENYNSLTSVLTMALVRFNVESPPTSLSAEWPAGSAFPDAGTISFSVVRGSAATPEVTIVLRNTGTAPLTNVSTELAGAGASRFSVLTTLPAILEPGASTMITVRFFPPPAVTTSPATLIIHPGSPDFDDFLVLLRGDTLRPEATLSLLEGTSPVVADATVDFGATVETLPVTKVFTVKNTGNIDLLVQGVSLGSGGNPGDFTVSPPETDTLAPGASTTFSVAFRPGGAGERTARLSIASTDTLHPPLEINLTGRLLEGIAGWILTWFGSGTSEDAWLTSDPDHDGIINLLEYASLSSPLEPGVFPGMLVKNGNTLEYSFTRPSSARQYLRYVMEWCDSLHDNLHQNQWTPLAGDPVVLEDDGTKQRVKYTLPAGENGKRFVRLRVSRE